MADLETARPGPEIPHSGTPTVPVEVAAVETVDSKESVRPDTTAPVAGGALDDPDHKERTDEGPQQNIQIGTLSSDDIQFINECKNFYVSDQATVSRAFSLKSVPTISRVVEARCAASFLGDSAEEAILLDVLQNRRFLIIVGERNSGKTAAALRLVHCLRTATGDDLLEPLHVASLDNRMRIDMHDMLEPRNKGPERVIMFKDVLSRNNQNLRDFLVRCTEDSLDRLVDRLAASRLRLVFTSEAHLMGAVMVPLASIGLCRQLRPLSQAHLLQCLETTIGATGAANELDAATRLVIVERARTAPRIIRFVTHHYKNVTTIANVHHAFDQIDDVGTWIFGDMIDDYDAWSFALVLGLVQCLPDSGGVPWLSFTRLKSALDERIRIRVQGVDAKPSYGRRSVSDTSNLERADAVIARDAASGRDMLRFNDARRAGRLWCELLDKSRSLLLSLWTPLIEVVQTGEPDVSMLAARILGRIGELDAVGLAFPLIGRWARSEKLSLRAAVGYMYHGILASDDSRYIELCLEKLAHIAESSHREGGRTAIATYRQIGGHDLVFAMERLRAIADDRLAPQIANMQKIDKFLSRLSAEKDRSLSDPETITLELCRIQLFGLAREIFEKQFQTMMELQFALISLCIEVGPLEAFTELRKWFRGSEGLRALVALMFLQKDGLAASLGGSNHVELGVSEFNRSSAASAPNLILLSISRIAGAEKQIASLLEDVFMGFYYFFPHESARYFRRAFFEHIRSWIIVASEDPSIRSDAERLLAALLRSNNRDLRTQCVQMLQEGVFRDGQSGLRDIAERALVAGLKRSIGY
ncbi:MAG: hypothetical protein JWM95_4282 [Gemmatimonadetes bacterium]|nr:hypothetical protein [Gemmatimonadota bacterium]